MRLTDGSFRQHRWHYIVQSLLATGTVLGVLIALDGTRQTAIIASIGASAFIVFATPNSMSSSVRSILGGYLVGCVAGICCSLLAGLIGHKGVEDWSSVLIAMGAVSVGLSIFLMVVTDTEHPPAAGLALALVLNRWDLLTLLVIALAILFLTAVKIFFGKKIRDLV